MQDTALGAIGGAWYLVNGAGVAVGQGTFYGRARVALALYHDVALVIEVGQGSEAPYDCLPTGSLATQGTVTVAFE